MIKEGDKAPDFTLPSHTGGNVTLTEFHGKHNVVLAFYPLDWTPVWSEQIPGYQDDLDKFIALDTQVLGVSVDSIPSHEAWAESLGGITYPLLSDFHPHGEVAQKYGVLTEDGFNDRVIYIIDKEGVVKYVDHHDIDDTPDNEDLFKILREMQSGWLTVWIWKGDVMLKIGDKAPDFTLDGSGGRRVTLSERETEYTVLVFYPKNNTPGWNRQLSALEADRQKFASAGAEILAVNPASVKSHDNYCEKKGFKFTILSDPDKKVLGKYEALKAMGKLVQRTVYVIGPDFKVVFAEQGMPPDDKILEAIRNDKR